MIEPLKLGLYEDEEWCKNHPNIMYNNRDIVLKINEIIEAINQEEQ